jgi:hypothetical protein
MYRKRHRGLYTAAVIASCLAGYAVFATIFNWFINPTVAKTPVRVVETQAHAAAADTPAAVAVTRRPAAATADPTAQLHLPSRFVRQPRQSPVADTQPVAKRQATATAAATAPSDAAPRPAPRRPVARTTVRQERQRNPWDAFAWGGWSHSRPWF